MTLTFHLVQPLGVSRSGARDAVSGITIAGGTSMSNTQLTEGGSMSLIADGWRHFRRTYSLLGWPGLLPREVGVYCFALRKVKREFGWRALLLACYDLTFTQAREQSGKEFRRCMCAAVTILLVIVSAIWTFVRFKPWIWAML